MSKNKRLQSSKLWREHVFWTRKVIIDRAKKSKFLKFDTVQLLQNQTDLANLLVYIYGRNVATLVENLLVTHIKLADAIVAAAIDGQDISLLSKQWYDNASEIAQALYSLNPKLYSLKHLNDMM